MIPGIIILALTSTSCLGIKIWDRKYVESVGLVPRLNVVGVPSEARLLYVVDNDISEGGAGTESHVRRKRGLLDYFRPRPVYRPDSTRQPYNNGFSSNPSSSGSRFGQPSILASSGELTSDTETASLTITPIATNNGYTVTRPTSGGSSLTFSDSHIPGVSVTTISATPWVTVSSTRIPSPPSPPLPYPPPPPSLPYPPPPPSLPYPPPPPPPLSSSSGSSSGQLTENTKTASLTINPVENIQTDYKPTRPIKKKVTGSRFGKPSILGSSGQLTENTKTASLSINPVGKK